MAYTKKTNTTETVKNESVKEEKKALENNSKENTGKYTENNLIWLSIFKYVLGNSELIPQDKLIER